MKYILSSAAIFSSFFLFSCSESGPKGRQGYSADTLPKASALDAYLYGKGIALFGYLPADASGPERPITRERIELGKILYHDTRLSKKGNISCNSCHNMKTAGVDNLPFSPGDDGMPGGRNSPTSFNAALHKTQFWDGRATDVENQAGMPILNPIEMNIPNKEFLVTRLKNVPGYRPLFDAAFPGSGESITYDNIATALGTFERTLVTPAALDKFLGQTDLEALSLDEKLGMKLFIETGCTNCHSGTALGGNMFQKFGVFGNYADYTLSKKLDMGRKEVTGEDADLYVFKTPSLRNVARTAPYFHDGSVARLEDAVKIMAKLQLNKDLKDEEVRLITAFLKTLSADPAPEAMEIPVLPM